MATLGLSYDNRSSPSGFALGNGTVINDNSSVLWINYYIRLSGKRDHFADFFKIDFLLPKGRVAFEL